MKRILFAVLISLAASQVARAGNVSPARGVEIVETTMYEAPTELSRVSAEPAAQVGGGHATALTWVLSTDDTTIACSTAANCLQNVYRASGACSISSSFSPLTTTPLSSTATAFTDSTVTPGMWCYGVTFSMNGVESAKDTASVTLQPASPTGAAATSK